VPFTCVQIKGQEPRLKYLPPLLLHPRWPPPLSYSTP